MGSNDAVLFRMEPQTLAADEIVAFLSTSTRVRLLAAPPPNDDARIMVVGTPGVQTWPQVDELRAEQLLWPSRLGTIM